MREDDLEDETMLNFVQHLGFENNEFIVSCVGGHLCPKSSNRKFNYFVDLVELIWITFLLIFIDFCHEC